MADKSAVNKTPVFAGSWRTRRIFPTKGYWISRTTASIPPVAPSSSGAFFPMRTAPCYPSSLRRCASAEPTQARLVVPNAVVLSDQQGDHVYVVNAKSVVRAAQCSKGPLKPGRSAPSRGPPAGGIAWS